MISNKYEHCEQGSNKAASQNAKNEQIEEILKDTKLIDSSSLVCQRGAPEVSKRSLFGINEHCEQGSNKAASQNAKNEQIEEILKDTKPIDSSSLVCQLGAPEVSKRSLFGINEHCEQGSNKAASQNAKSILLFGNKGQVGQDLQELFLAQGFIVYGFDVADCDVTDLQQLTTCFAENAHEVSVVINATAYTAVDKAEDEIALAYAVNRDAVKNLAVLCKQYNLPLLHISTDYVFDGEKNAPYNEQDAASPLGIYGKSKLAGEEVLAQNWHKYIILRISWVFGKHGGNFVKTILRLAKEREVLNVVGDQYGCPTPAADVARVLLAMTAEIIAGKEHWGIYHYCGKPATDWYEFAQIIIKLAKECTDLKLQQLNKIATIEYPTKAQRPRNSELSVNKIVVDYGISQHEWLEYLREVVDFVAKNGLN